MAEEPLDGVWSLAEGEGKCGVGPQEELSMSLRKALQRIHNVCVGLLAKVDK